VLEDMLGCGERGQGITGAQSVKSEESKMRRRRMIKTPGNLNELLVVMCGESLV